MLSEIDIKSTEIEYKVLNSFLFFLTEDKKTDIIYRPIVKTDRGYFNELTDLCFIQDDFLYLIEIKGFNTKSKHWKNYKSIIKLAKEQLDKAEKTIKSTFSIMYNLNDRYNLMNHNYYDIKKQESDFSNVCVKYLNEDIKIIKVVVLYGIDNVSKKVKRYSNSFTKGYEKEGSKYGGLFINPTKSEGHSFYYTVSQFDNFCILTEEQLKYLQKYIKTGKILNSYFKWRFDVLNLNVPTREQTLISNYIENLKELENFGFLDYSDDRIEYFEENYKLKEDKK